MNEEQKQLMARIVSDVMEQMSFMFTGRVDRGALEASGARFIQARIAFSGPIRGALTLVIPDTMCTELASNILGMEADATLVRSSAIDAFKEILNVICGHVIGGLAGEQESCEIQPPTAQALTPRQWEALEMSEETLCFSVDEHPMLMHLALEAEAHEHPRVDR
jgi:chemotaxis protein CheY-P-specific phosphatase CheC